MFTTPLIIKAPFRAISGYLTGSRLSIGSTTLPLGTAFDTYYNQVSSDQVLVLKDGAFSIHLALDLEWNGSFSASGTTKIELVKNSTVLAYCQSSYNSGTNVITYSESGFKDAKNIDNVDMNTSTVSGSGFNRKGKIIFQTELELLASDLIYLRTTNSVAVGANTIVMKNYQLTINKIT